MKDRARQVLEMKAEGMQSKQISGVLGIHIRTVNHHLNEAKRDLEAKNIYNAIALAVKRGVIFTGKLAIVLCLSNAILQPEKEFRQVRIRPIRINRSKD